MYWQSEELCVDGSSEWENFKPNLIKWAMRNRETRRVVSCRATPSEEDSRVLRDADWGIRLLSRNLDLLLT
ncbi:hypothetical protein CFP56_038080 [Quercus suber]|uniref:Uncharacterized protein n=1 Tax=Quercus suber TaxID=58331 RepID=A0AAW0J3K3_QUESU